jgi:hypothetical protein
MAFGQAQQDYTQFDLIVPCDVFRADGGGLTNS